MDFENTTISKWEDHAGLFYGMRLRGEGGVKHGIVREILPCGKIAEMTYVNNTQIGLARNTWSSGVSYSVKGPDGMDLCTILIGPDW